ncbi:FliM/FliN family flagellar motor switch protein [Falsirhodobacter xinxiangensis]|uniref:FliM/FliN family flagellar motor switch protein n=1 Tax=Falsirhodobacter xinxiangensis TaxID=2530049 RepID=UPI0010AA71F1|nr:FliM/FliN family flagellar motor switch protein [Rhodobacter xinxiangensis]
MTIRRKLSLAKPAAESGGDRIWRMALARAARDGLSLALSIIGLSVSRVSLGELLESLPDRALLGMLEGPGGMGLVALSPEVLAAMTEVQTIGKVTDRPVPTRRPTRTDAAMVSGVVDLALTGLEEGLASDHDLVWAGGYRYHSFLPDPRPLDLLLEDFGYRLMVAQVSLGDGIRRGEVVLALPAEGRGDVPVLAEPEDEGFTERLAEQVMAVDAVMDAVLYRVTVPLSAVLNWAEGDTMPLPLAALDRILLEGQGRRLAEGKLGQNRGMRALRLAAQEPVNVVPLRAVG